MRACITYLAFIAVIGFIFGRMIPIACMKWERFPFKSLNWEDDGRVYLCLNIQSWQDKLPDLSRVFTKIMPAKKLPNRITEENITLMLQETCIAELVHGLVGIAGLFCILIWPGWGGTSIALLWLIGNIPFILVQRYTRPKLRSLLQRIIRRSFAQECRSGGKSKGKERQFCES